MTWTAVAYAALAQQTVPVLRVVGDPPSIRADQWESGTGINHWSSTDGRFFRKNPGARRTTQVEPLWTDNELKQCPIVPGLFCYHGLGMGCLYLPSGVSVWCHPSEARRICEAAGLTFKYFDILRGY